MPVITRTILLLVLIILCASHARAQLCGMSFSSFIVSDSAGQTVPNPTIEVLAIVPKDIDKQLWSQHSDGQHPSDQGYYKISDESFRQVIQRSTPLAEKKDACGNRLKQRANQTEVKTPDDYIENRKPGKKSFGLCTDEINLTRFIMKISAPGYITSYYIGAFLGGCNHRVYFELIKSKKFKK